MKIKSILLISAATGAIMFHGQGRAETLSSPDSTTFTVSSSTVDAAADPSGTEIAGQQSSSASDVRSDIVVNGIRQAYSEAIEEKRKDLEISDGISADGLENLPDLNIGEALARLPGVQINRSDEGRDATVTVRGLPGEYALPTMNGVIFAIPTTNNTNPFGAYLTDIFTGVRVEKTPMADVQSGGVAGRINLNITGALSLKDRLNLKANYEYDELGSLGAPGAAVRWVHHFGNNLAVLANVAYRKQNFRRDEVDYSAYNNLSSSNTPDFAAKYGQYFANKCPSPVPVGTICAASGQGTGAVSTSGAIYPSQVRQYVRPNKGETLSASASIEYQPAHNLKFGLSGFYTDRNMHGTKQYFVQTILTGKGTTILPQSDPVALDDGRRLIQDVSFLNPEVRMSSRLLPTRQNAGGLFLTGDWKPGGWKIHGVASVSRANAHAEEQMYDFETTPDATAKLNGAGNGIAGEWNSGNGSGGGFLYQLTPPPGETALVSATPTYGSWIWGGSITSGTSGYDPTNFQDSTNANDRRRRIRISGAPTAVQNDVQAYKLTVERGVVPGFSLAFGLDRQILKSTSTGSRTDAYGAQVQNLTDAQIIPAPFQNSFFGGHGTFIDDWTISDPSFKKLVQPVTVYPGASLNSIGFNIYYADAGYSRFNYTYTNAITAGFIQAKFETEMFGVPVRGNYGLRYERLGNTLDALTRQTISNNGVGAPSDFVDLRFKHKFDYVLPSIIVAADLTNKLVLRAAAYKSYAQPLIRQLNVVTLVNAATENAATGNRAVTVQLGNPDLHPYTAFSQDLSLEWYNRRGSVISIAGFAKQIRGFITNITDPAERCPADGTPYGLGHLTYDTSTERCLSDLAAPGTEFVVNISGNRNYNDVIKIYGLEFNVQQNFDFLPGPLKHLGGIFNYTYTYNKGKVNGGIIRLSGVAPQTRNIVLYYETKRFGIRMTHNWRSSYEPDTYYTAGNAQRTTAARSQLDGSLSVKVTPQISLYASAFNITNARVYQYVGQPVMPDRASYDGRTYVFSIRANF